MFDRRNNQSKRILISDILIGILSGLFFYNVGCLLILNLRPLYYFNISRIKFSEQVSELPLKSIYRSLCDYMLPWNNKALSLPGLPLSSGNLEVLADIKSAVFMLYVITALFLLILISALIWRNMDNHHGSLLSVAIFSISTPTIINLVLFFWLPDIFGFIYPLLFDHRWTNETPSLADLFPQLLRLEISLLCVLPGLIAFIFFLIRFFSKRKVRKDPELLPRKRNYYYI